MQTLVKPVHTNPNLLLSPGTQVVTLIDVVGSNSRIVHPVGTVGVVLKSPTDLQHAYRIRFPDGTEEPLKQNQLVMLAKFKEGELSESNPLHREQLFERVIYRCVVGSRAYGLDDEKSDIDYRGVYLPTADRHWSLYGVPEQLECNETQEVYWELQKLLTLALKANPNVLECLYTPVVETATPLALELLDMRCCFLSKLVYQTFNGYVMSQFRKMQSDIRNQGSVKWKHVMHLIRLLLSGIHAMKEGYVQVRVEEHRDQLLAIKRDEMPWNETMANRASPSISSRLSANKTARSPRLSNSGFVSFESQTRGFVAGNPLNIPSVVQRYADEHPYPLLFATISGDHLYGFPSPDSDTDIRGSHRLPLPDVIGLSVANETVDRTQIVDNVEVDIVTHDFIFFRPGSKEKRQRPGTDLLAAGAEVIAGTRRTETHCQHVYYSESHPPLRRLRKNKVEADSGKRRCTG